ncbi:MAG: GNAT family N-acetyltransferase [Bauldia sp.]|nr:GNAT family N-acetyltransferase [Bauldia sp.]
MSPALTISPMTLNELAVVLDWAAAEGWNPGIGDAAAFHAADANGFLLGRLGEEPVAAISVVRYGERFAFLGLYICRPEFRGRGYGMALWNAAMDLAGGRTIGLDGVVEQQANYAKSGFAYAHRNVRYGGVITGPLPEAHDVVPLGRVGRDEVAAFDRRHFGFDRAGFLRAWLDRTGGRTALAHVRGGALDGYGVIRDCREGAKIGPLFAGSPPAARALLLALAATRPGQTIYLDLPEPNAEAVALAEGLGLTPRFETARMYRGPAPALPLDRIYGITSFELG